MQVKNKNSSFNTNDQNIRTALRQELQRLHHADPVYRIFEELGVNHGSVRADIAVVNGIMHCYEIKSDRDTLLRLPSQAKAYNAVFDRVTIVVGLSHIYEAMEVIPDWWGITLAKIGTDGSIIFSKIRSASDNQSRDGVSIARLLWREEALHILEEVDQAYGLRSKPRNEIYKRLAEILEVDILASKVREVLCFRSSWRAAEEQV